jgi:hypothetical protein
MDLLMGQLAPGGRLKSIRDKFNSFLENVWVIIQPPIKSVSAPLFSSGDQCQEVKTYEFNLQTIHALVLITIPAELL